MGLTRLKTLTLEELIKHSRVIWLIGWAPGGHPRCTFHPVREANWELFDEDASIGESRTMYYLCDDCKNFIHPAKLPVRNGFVGNNQELKHE